MPRDELADTVVRTWGPAGATWLATRDRLLADLAGELDLELGATLPQTFHAVRAVTCADGTPAVLKAGVPDGHLDAETAALRAWDGDGAVRLLWADPTRGALLLERADPGTELTAVPDDRAVEVIGGLLARLHRAPVPAGLDHVAVERAAFDAHLTRPDAVLPRPLVERAATLWTQLCGSAEREVLLHGDLHQHNVLAATRDPRAVAGDRPARPGRRPRLRLRAAAVQPPGRRPGRAGPPRPGPAGTARGRRRDRVGPRGGVGVRGVRAVGGLGRRRRRRVDRPRPRARRRTAAGGARRGLSPYSAAMTVSETFDPDAWTPVDGFDFRDITYHRARDTGAVRIAFDRPEVLNAFRPGTVDELYRALEHARTSSDVGAVLLTGNGPSPKDGKRAFCSGGDQRIRGRTGYQYASGDTAETVEQGRAGRLHILECQRLIRFMPKVVIAVVNGWAAGGGHSLHAVADLTIASREHARFKQTDADVGSFDGGYGSAYLARQVGQKFAREIFFLGRTYSAEQMHHMGAVNAVVDHAELETEALQWAREINGKSPQAQRMLKYAFNLADDGLVGQQLFAGEATRLAYMTDEAVEGRDSFLEKRDPDWSPFPWHY